MSEWRMYKHAGGYDMRYIGLASMTPWVEGFDMAGVLLSEADRSNGSPSSGDMIARNPFDKQDRWFVSGEYFRANFGLLSPTEANNMEVGDLNVKDNGEIIDGAGLEFSVRSAIYLEPHQASWLVESGSVKTMGDLVGAVEGNSCKVPVSFPGMEEPVLMDIEFIKVDNAKKLSWGDGKNTDTI